MKRLLAITGPTASGKTTRAVSLARRLDGEIVSADSRQVYRGMDIGTGKDLAEYASVAPPHLIDVAEAGEKYNLYRFLADAQRSISEIRSRGRLPIVCGGTGLYLEALLNGLELPEVPRNEQLRTELEGMTLAQLTERLAAMKRLHNTTDVDSIQRAVRAIEIEEYYLSHPAEAANTRPKRREDALIVCVDIDREARRARISQRLRSRLENGMVDEVKRLLDNGVAAETLIYYGLEYKFITLYLTDRMNYSEMVSGLETAIHQFAKRQMTWIRGMERRGFSLEYLPYDMPADEFDARVLDLMNQ